MYMGEQPMSKNCEFKKMKNGSISERVHRVRRKIGSILMIAGQNKQDQVKHVVFLRSDVLCEVACRSDVRKYQTLKKYSLGRKKFGAQAIYLFSCRKKSRCDVLSFK